MVGLPCYTTPAAGLLYLQHANDASDEMVANTWLGEPALAVFTGETYLQTELPIDPSSRRAGASALVKKAWSCCWP